MMNNKRGFIVSAGLLIAAAVLVAIILGGLSLFTALLAANVWRLAGLVIIAFLGLALLGVGGLPRPSDKIMLITFVSGIALIFLPFLSDSFNLPLFAILP